MALSFKSFSLVLSVVLLKLLFPANGQGETNLSTTLGEKQYFVSLSQKVNWFRAAQICSVLGMSLASIESETEKTNLEQYLFSNSHLTDQFWLSGTDLALSREFTWISSGKRFSYKNWAASEPLSTASKRCVKTSANFEWAVDVCDNLHYFICSRPVTPDCGITGRCSYNYNNAG